MQAAEKQVELSVLKKHGRACGILVRQKGHWHNGVRRYLLHADGDDARKVSLTRVNKRNSKAVHALKLVSTYVIQLVRNKLFWVTEHYGRS
jgi:hypothetical protein